MKPILLAAIAASMPIAAFGQDLTLSSTETGYVGYQLRQSGRAASMENGHWQVRRVPLETSDEQRRGFAVFDLPQLDRIAAATLQVPIRSGSMTPVAKTPLVVFQDLRADDLTNAEAFPTEFLYRLSLWSDLGHGRFFGMLDLSPNTVEDAWSQDIPGSALKFQSSDFHSIALSPLAVHDLNRSRDGLWAVGASLLGSTSIDPGVTSFLADTPLRLDLTFGPPPPLGDFDGSGRVDQTDLDFVLLNWGQESIDQDELDAVLTTWGASSPLAATAAIPEPSTICLCLWVIGWLALSRRAPARA